MNIYPVKSRRIKKFRGFIRKLSVVRNYSNNLLATCNEISSIISEINDHKEIYRLLNRYSNSIVIMIMSNLVNRKFRIDLSTTYGYDNGFTINRCYKFVGSHTGKPFKFSIVIGNDKSISLSKNYIGINEYSFIDKFYV